MSSRNEGPPTRLPRTGGAHAARAVWAIDATTVLLATADGDVWRSEDGGTSWSPVHDEPGVKLLDLWGSAGGDVFAAGGAEATMADARHAIL